MNIENIYSGCIDNSEVIERDYDISWDEQLDIKKAEYEDMGYKVVFVFAANHVSDRARVVLYDKNQAIPQYMQKYRRKYVRVHGHWVIESQLKICDQCGNYDEIVCEYKPPFENGFKMLCRTCCHNTSY